MPFRRLAVCAFLILLARMPARATIFGDVRGIVHDPLHRPVGGAQIILRAKAASWSESMSSNANGEFEFRAVPAGDYVVEVRAEGFEPLEQTITVASGIAPVLHCQMEVAIVKQSVEVSATESKLKTQSSTVQTAVSAGEITRTAGADRTNSLGMITNFTPGAYMVHDMLHMRDGHQVNWFLDGIPVINTNIAANVAPMINPKNVESLEVERGGYSSEYGDRTYGVFNVVTPSGFDRDRQGELVMSYGNFHTTDDQLSFGDHTERFAYYASLDGNRSDLGLTTPTSAVIHDQDSGLGGFLSLLYNASPHDQLRWIASLRGDHYAIPNDPGAQAQGTRDLDLERDDLVGFEWVHYTSGWILSVSPYFNFNGTHFLGGPGDTPFVLNEDSRSDYMGARAMVQSFRGRHDVRVGAESWWQRDYTLFDLAANPGTQALNQQELHWANTDSLFAEDTYRPMSWLTLNGGFRFVHYGGLLSENAADPRLGAGVRIPHLGWTLHGYYSYYYQPPPLDSLSGGLLNLALITNGASFSPLPGERDIQSDVGLAVPLHGWTLDVDHYHTNARNFLDHDELGNSNVFIPLSDLAALISGTEVSVRSPKLWDRAQLRIAYANAIGKGLGPITGGLIEFLPTSYFYLDHDQRNGFSAVLSLNLPRSFWATPSVNFGSGFVNGGGPAHLPPHTTADLALGRNFGENWSFSMNGTNVLNHRFLMDTSNTFGGTHFVNRREIYGEVRFRFRY
jgi:carboxypeptidase family protein/TonB-dependent receptor-like protein